MSQFFILDDSDDPKIIGNNYPQCKGLMPSYKDEGDGSFYHFGHFKGKKIDFVPKMDGIILFKTTKITDLLSCPLGPGHDLIISSKFRELLMNFKLGPLQFFDCYFYQGEHRIKYHWVHFIYDLQKKIDYQRSEFYHQDEELMPDVNKISSYSEYLDFSKVKDKFRFLKSKKLFVELGDLDLFAIGHFKQKAHVSVKLKNALLKEGITGVKFKKAEDIIAF